MKKVGAFILVVGIVLSLFAGYNYVTRKKVMDLGNVEISQKENHTLPWSPIVGIVMIVTGAGIYLIDGKGK